MENKVLQLAQMLREAKAITFFGGAGVSTESGIPDFRSAQGLYHQQRSIPPETILSYSFFRQQPAVFYEYYRTHLLAPEAQPNAAHLALAAMESQGRLRAVVTQNIDGLHQAAGSNEVLELHGSVHRNYCMACGKRYTLDDILNRAPLPLCGCGGLIRPDVVLYEEGLDDAIIRRAVAHIQASDLLLVGGTSLSVYPAAGFAQLCPGKLVIINRDPTHMDQQADLVIRAPIGQTLGEAMAVLDRLNLE